jgi:hypothetical protein
MAVTVIRNFIAKALFKKQGAIANNKAVEFSANALENRLKNLGIDPNAITSEKELNQILSYVKQAEDQAFQQRFGDMLGGSKFDRKGEVFDMTGKKINPSKGIMGGKEINEQTLKEGLMKTDNPYSDLVKTTEQGPKTLKQREAEVLARMEKDNKAAVQRIKNRKMIEEAIDNASPGFAGDRKYDAQLVADDLAEKRFGKEFYDLDEIDQMELYDEAYQGLTKQKFDPPEDLATGGRAGYKLGTGKKGIQTLLNFFNKKSPYQAGKDYLKNIKDKTLKANETGKFMDLPLAEVGIPATTGALINNQLRKKLEAMNEEQKEQNLKEFIQELNADPFYKKNPELKDKTIEAYTERMFGEKRADGGRIGYANGTGAPSIKYDFDKKQESMGPTFETNDPEEALKEIVKRMINVDPAKVPLSKDMMLMFDLDRAKIGGQKNIGGGELSFGINKGFGRDDTGIGFNFRKQFKNGSGMSRRSFLKILGGLASIPIVGKFLKPIKTAKGIKSVPIIKTDNVAGKPEWFDALVNKVIIEGDDVTKKFATGERQSIHQKTLNDGSVVRVTEDVDDGAVRVEYDSPDNVFEDTVQMEYKKPLPDEGAPNPAAEFSTAEAGPVGRRYGPDDYEIEVDEIGGSSIRDLDSDVSKLKEYATGKGPTIREIIQNKKRKDKARRLTTDPEAQSDAVVRRQGEVNESDYDVPDDAFASGGIARMLGE